MGDHNIDAEAEVDYLLHCLAFVSSKIDRVGCAFDKPSAPPAQSLMDSLVPSIILLFVLENPSDHLAPRVFERLCVLLPPSNLFLRRRRLRRCDGHVEEKADEGSSRHSHKSSFAYILGSVAGGAARPAVNALPQAAQCPRRTTSSSLRPPSRQA